MKLIDLIKRHKLWLEFMQYLTFSLMLFGIFTFVYVWICRILEIWTGFNFSYDSQMLALVVFTVFFGLIFFGISELFNRYHIKENN